MSNPGNLSNPSGFGSHIPGHPGEPTPTDPPARRRRSVLPVVLIVAAIGGLWWFTGRAAPTPQVFAQGLSLDEAVAQAGPGGLVFAVATADWCPPCQSYKRGALADERVQAWVEANTVPVYIDVDARPQDAQRLEVSGIPATFLLRDGVVIAGGSGAMPTETLLRWLETARAQ
jgi:thiol:disulfide interchange protein